MGPREAVEPERDVRTVALEAVVQLWGGRRQGQVPRRTGPCSLVELDLHRLLSGRRPRACQH